MCCSLSSSKGEWLEGEVKKPVINTAVTAELQSVALDTFKQTPTEKITMVKSMAQSCN